jgi:hypothetical protein
MMLDADVAAVSPSSGWRVLPRAGLLSRWKRKLSRKGTGFEQPHMRINTGRSIFPTSRCVARSVARHAAVLEAKVDELTQLAPERAQTLDEQRKGTREPARSPRESESDAFHSGSISQGDSRPAPK